MEEIFFNDSKNSLRKFILDSPSSYAGAFGCSQFIPSSFQKYAVSHESKTPNLFNIYDCIYSVGNFLQKNGWNNGDLSSQSNALFEYNRIKDYGDVILKLASAAKTNI
jgi:membrane-bound lytic murein transglycosylase B